MSIISKDIAEEPNQDCGCNMLRKSTDDRCTCKSKINDCPTFVNYKCSECGCECKLRCNICTTCFPHVDHEQIDSQCYDCSLNLNWEAEHYEGW